MRRTLAVFAAATILLSAASFNSAQATSIGLYVDNIHYQNCEPWPRLNGRYTVWSWCLPSAEGVQGACFAVIWNGNLVRGPEQVNASVVDHYSGTNFLTGLTFYYNSCQYGWHWIHKEAITLIDVDPHTRNYLFIEEGVMEHAGMVWRCGVNQSWVPFTITKRAYFGHCSPIATESVTWGAIKSLYSE